MPTQSRENEWPIEAERDFWAAECRDNLWSFAQIAWGVEFYMADNPQDRWMTRRVHGPIIDWLQEHVERWERRRRRGKKRRTKLAVIVPRGFGKTVSVSKIMNLWTMVRDPNLSNYLGSEVVTKAEDFLKPIKDVMTGSDPYGYFSWLYGNWIVSRTDPSRKWSTGSVIHAARRNTAKTEPSFGTWGIEGGITGHHPDIGILDDPLSEEKIKDSGVWIATVNQSFAALRPAFRSDSLFILVCTRYRDNDCAGTYLKREGIRTWTGMPCTDSRLTISKDGEWDVYFLQARDKSGASILPEVHPTAELNAYEKSLPGEFAAQMMNEPGVGEHMALTSEQIDSMYMDRDDLPGALTYTIHCDTAFKDLKQRGRGDESVIIVFGHDPRGNGRVYYIEGYGSDRWRLEDFNDKLVEIVGRYRDKRADISCITDEREVGGKGGSWEVLIRAWHTRAGIRCPRIRVLPRGNTRKIRRIQEAAGYWVDGNVKLVRGAPGVQHLVNQMVRLGIVGHDDWADAASDCFHPDVYRPMLISDSNDEGAVPKIPGDDLLKGFRKPKTDDEVRFVYDNLGLQPDEESELGYG